MDPIERTPCSNGDSPELTAQSLVLSEVSVNLHTYCIVRSALMYLLAGEYERSTNFFNLCHS